MNPGLVKKKPTGRKYDLPNSDAINPLDLLSFLVLPPSVVDYSTRIPYSLGISWLITTF